jgi:hypothetical protein
LKYRGPKWATETKGGILSSSKNNAHPEQLTASKNMPGTTADNGCKAYVLENAKTFLDI